MTRCLGTIPSADGERPCRNEAAGPAGYRRSCNARRARWQPITLTPREMTHVDGLRFQGTGERTV